MARYRSVILVAAGCLVTLAVSVSFAPVVSHSSENGKKTIGRVEYVYLGKNARQVKARIDTGAGVSSMHARIIEIKTGADGREKVRFALEYEPGKEMIFTRTLVEWTNIKKKLGGTVRRPVVRLALCIAGRRVYGRVNLADRSHMIYPVLIGRNLLKVGDFVVDPALHLTSKDRCPANVPTRK